MLSPLSFRLEYKRGATTTPTMFQRQVRMQVNINDISEGNDGGSSMPVHAITFTLLSGIESYASFFSKNKIKKRKSSVLSKSISIFFYKENEGRVNIKLNKKNK